MTTARELGDFGGVVTVEGGNVGLGVTPAAWDSTYRALQINTTGAINANAVAVVMSNNYRYDGTNFRYLTTAPASDYFQFNGTHTWRYAASGSAGAVATMNTGMVMDASGNVGIGTSSPGGKLEVNQGKLVVKTTDQSLSRVQIANTGTSGRTWELVGGLPGVNNSNFSIYDVTGSTTPLTIDSSGNLLVGTTTSSARLTVQADSSAVQPVVFNSTAAGTGATSLVRFRRNGTNVGEIEITGSTTTYATSSDYRLKEDVQPMAGALAKVAALKPVTYKWKVDGSDGQGFIAHELQEVVPDAVTGQKDAVETYTDEEGNEQTRPKYQGIDTSFLVATLTAAIQEQQALIQSLTQRIAALEGASGTPAVV
jgi:hypothetical protein